MALLNADWRDFESTPASKENPDNSITIFDYHRVLSKTGWKVTHRIEGNIRDVHYVYKLTEYLNYDICFACHANQE